MKRMQDVPPRKRFVNYEVISFWFFSLLPGAGWHGAGKASRTPVGPHHSALPAAGGPAPSATSPAASAPPLDPTPSGSGHWGSEPEASQLEEKTCKQRKNILLHSVIYQSTPAFMNDSSHPLPKRYQRRFGFPFQSGSFQPGKTTPW